MKRYTLKFAISTLVSGLILLSVASIATALYYGTKRALFLTTNEMMGQVSRAMGDKLTTRLEKVEKLNVLMAELILSGKVDPAREEVFTDFLKDILAATPSVSLIDCGLPSGHKYQARRMPDGSISRRIVHRGAHEVASTWRHQNPAYAKAYPDTVKSLEEGYDPRTRPWWKAGLQSGKQAWTQIYGNTSGLNYSNVNPVFDARGRLACIVAIDMKVQDLSLFLSGIKVGRTGKAFIIDKDFRVVAMPLPSEGDLGRMVKQVAAGSESEFALKDIDELEDANIRHAVRRYRKAPLMGGRDFLAFRDPEGRRMLASFEPEPVYGFTFGVVVPEEEILGSIKRSLNLTLALTGVLLVVSLLAAYAISRAIARPLGDLAGEVDRIRLLDLDDRAPVATAIAEVALIGQSVRNMKQGLRSFKKYVPADVVTRLMHLQKEAEIEGESRELTVFFSDIAHFTDLSEQLSPERLVEMLGHYFEGVTRILLDHAGTVDKFIGDAVMAFWGAPSALPDHAAQACRAALKAQARIRELNAQWLAEGGVAFHTRMGLHTGEAIVGNIGCEGRMNYTAIGDTVNLASRLEGLNKFYDTRILISETTLRAAGDAILARKVDLVTVKGKVQAVGIFELLAMREDADEATLEAAAAFNTAFAHYEHQHWAEGLAILEALPGDPDGPRRTLLERLRHFQAAPPGPDWDGVFRHMEK